METLREFLNSMNLEEQEKFAVRCGTTRGYLRKACYKRCELGPELSVMIERESSGRVTRKSLHPDTFLKKWPELKQSKSKTANA